MIMFILIINLTTNGYTYSQGPAVQAYFDENYY